MSSRLSGSTMGRTRGGGRRRAGVHLQREQGEAARGRIKGLSEYARKRNFDLTTEPSPATRRARRSHALRFVIQKHAASHLHYDFRLEWDGALLSWAVPKGPSWDPKVKRLAMAVEDHPLEYANFEGIIPAGEYGGGTVMVWDRGTYVPRDPDVGESRRKGRIAFTLAGKKLKGEWVLVRTGPPDSRSWLLIKHGDGAAAAHVLDRQPRSVISDRLMAEIAFDEGGDVQRAAATDPPSALRRLMKDPRTRTRVPRARPAVWSASLSKQARSRGGHAGARRSQRA